MNQLMIMRAQRNSIWYPIRYMATLVWVGAVLSISFMEAPLKFQAPSVTLSIGLEIGRLVFGALNKLEWGLLLLMVGSFLMSGIGKKAWVLGTMLLLILSAQTFHLLPVLDQQAALIIQGDTPDSSAAHFQYVILEVIKLILLITLSIHFIYQNHERSS